MTPEVRDLENCPCSSVRRHSELTKIPTKSSTVIIWDRCRPRLLIRITKRSVSSLCLFVSLISAKAGPGRPINAMSYLCLGKVDHYYAGGGRWAAHILILW